MIADPIDRKNNAGCAADSTVRDVKYKFLPEGRALDTARADAPCSLDRRCCRHLVRLSCQA